MQKHRTPQEIVLVSKVLLMEVVYPIICRFYTSQVVKNFFHQQNEKGHTGGFSYSLVVKPNHYW